MEPSGAMSVEDLRLDPSYTMRECGVVPNTMLSILPDGHGDIRKKQRVYSADNEGAGAI